MDRSCHIAMFSSPVQSSRVRYERSTLLHFQMESSKTQTHSSQLCPKKDKFEDMLAKHSIVLVKALPDPSPTHLTSHLMTRHRLPISDQSAHAHFSKRDKRPIWDKHIPKQT
jgi:hypothetical protein